MKHHANAFVRITILLSVGWAWPTPAEPIPEPPSPSDNAAVWYLTAHMFMPGDDDENLIRVIDSWENPDLKEAAQSLKSVKIPLDYIRRGAALERCAWAADFKKDGIATLLPQLTHMRQYAKLLVVSAQVRMSNGDTEGAIDDLIAIMHVSRHAAADGSLIGCLVQISMDKLAVDAIAKQLHRFDRTELESVRARLNALPSRYSVQSSIATERLLSVWLKRLLLNNDGKIDTQQLKELGLTELNEALKGKDAKKHAELLTQWFDEMDAFYQRLYDNFGLPYDQFVKADAQYVKDIENSDNVFIKMLMPALGTAYKTERRAKSMYVILDAAIALRLGGDEAFNAVTDPADGKPFDREVTDAGLVLSSRLKKNDQALSVPFDREIARPLP